MIMALNPVLAWLIVALALFIIEVLSGTVALLCLCFGSISAAIAAACGVPVAWQVAITAFVTLAVFFICGSKIKKYYANLRRHHRDTSNMEAIIGRTGRVTNQVTGNYTDGGRVQIDGDNWQAYTEPANSPIPTGAIVVVEKYDSIVIRVRPAQHPVNSSSENQNH